MYNDVWLLYGGVCGLLVCMCVANGINGYVYYFINDVMAMCMSILLMAMAMAAV